MNKYDICHLAIKINGLQRKSVIKKIRNIIV